VSYRERRRDWRWYLAAVLLVGGAVALAYSQFISPEIHSTLLPTHPAYVVLGDVSNDSTPSTRARAQAVLEEVIDHARDEQGFVAATPFQNAAIANADWQPKDFIPSKDVRHDGRGTTDELHDRAVEFKKLTMHLFEHQRRAHGTDVIGALYSATDEVMSFHAATSRSVIIVSNMANVDYSPDGVILKKVLQANAIQEKLQKLQRLLEIPNQHGIYFYIVGGGVIPGESISPEVESTIRRFWNGYFVLSGGTPAGWASTLDWPLSRKRISLSP
jgi:hypothetical protein